MDTQEFIPVEIFCQHHHVEISFVNDLHSHGLVEIIHTYEMDCIRVEQLAEAEKLTRMHHDLDLNIEGLAAVFHLLQKVKTMQDEINSLRSQLSLYEGD